jgi:hypothetical protein
MEATLVDPENPREDPIVTKVHFLRVIGVKLQENAKKWMPASAVHPQPHNKSLRLRVSNKSPADHDSEK